MRIGIPTETRWEEKRIALAPAGVDSLIRSGHTVYIQSGAGEASHFTDDEYREVGATIVYTREEAFGRAEMIVKVSPLTEEEADLLVENQILFSFLLLTMAKKNILEKSYHGFPFDLGRKRAIGCERSTFTWRTCNWLKIGWCSRSN